MKAGRITDMLTIQVQSVVNQNEIESLKRTVMAVANAGRVLKEIDRNECRITFIYGDRSIKRVMSEQDEKKLRERVKPYIDFQYYVFEERVGLAQGHNLLLKHGQAEYVLIVSPGSMVAPHFFREALKAFENPQVGMVEARKTPFEHPKVYDERTLETSCATTTCTMIRRSAFEELNGFDHESFFSSFADVDLSWRLRLAEYKILYQPFAPVYCIESLCAEEKQRQTEAEAYYSAEAALMLAHKWSNTDRVKTLLREYEKGSEQQRQAVSAFIRKKEESRLPVPIDPEHRIARFFGDDYSEQRFKN